MAHLAGIVREYLRKHRLTSLACLTDLSPLFFQREKVWKSIFHIHCVARSRKEETTFLFDWQSSGLSVVDLYLGTSKLASCLSARRFGLVAVKARSVEECLERLDLFRAGKNEVNPVHRVILLFVFSETTDDPRLSAAGLLEMNAPNQRYLILE